MAHFMLDIETLGLKSGCQILTIACARFNPSSSSPYLLSFYKRIDLNDYVNYNYSVDENTKKWWEQQSADVRYEAFEKEPRTTVRKTFLEFNKFIRESTKERERIYMWSHGKEFDIPMVERYLTDLGLPVFWKFWDTRDTRTVYDLAGVNLKSIEKTLDSSQKHNAEYDVKLQILGIQEAFKKLGLDK
jgi:exodeoxyribonuclease VIII